MNKVLGSHTSQGKLTENIVGHKATELITAVKGFKIQAKGT
jgi:hypothetical protein